MISDIPSVENVVDFRAKWKQFVQKNLKAEFIKPVSMVNSGYLHALNASFDGLFLREQSTTSLLSASRPMCFGTIQPCARPDDKLAERSSPFHLGLFEICGTSILGFEHLRPEQATEVTVKEFMTFYKDCLGLDPSCLRVFYFGGASLESIGRGRVVSQQELAPDDFSFEIWKSNGLADYQLIPEYTNDTFLLHVANPLREHHSGYRNDIFFEADGVRFEIATLNFITHRSVIVDGVITEVVPLSFFLREIAFGQERCLSAIYSSKDVYHLPHVFPLVRAMQALVDDPQMALYVADAFRVVHYVVSDGWTLDKLSGRKHREHRGQLKEFLKVLSKVRAALNDGALRELLFVNSECQPWYPSLEEGVDATLTEIRSVFGQ